jgi:hypothetical protein
MCSVGRSGWLMLDSESCFLGADLAMRSCFCPLTTCTETTTGRFQCMYTSLTVTIAVTLVVLWLSGIACYWYASWKLDDESLKPQRQHGGRVSDVLFGVYHASSDHGDHAHPDQAQQPTELTSLVAAKPAGHGTF